MSYSKLCLMIVLALCAGYAFADIAVNFRDLSSPNITLTLARMELADYPLATPKAQRFFIQFYKDGGDNLISPLDSSGQPTGDDVEAITVAGAATKPSGIGGLNFSPTGLLNMNGLIVADADGIGNTHQGDKIYIRVFNATSKTAATKYIAFNTLYTIPKENDKPSLIDYGWSGWINIPTATPLNAVKLISPGKGKIKLSNEPLILQWSPGAGGIATGYRIYFGTNNPPSNIVNGTIITKTSFTMETLQRNKTYYWRIVPFDSMGDALDCPVWRFKTK